MKSICPMSYDLYLYKKTSSEHTSEFIWNELKHSIILDKSDSNDQIEYDNEITGVYFLVDLNEPNQDQEDIDLFEKFDGFNYTNISVSVNFIRPDYFGLEIFPMLSSIFERLDLYVLNLQELDESKQNPLKWGGVELTEHWLKHNQMVCSQQSNELGLKYCKKQTSDAAWIYSTFKQKLEDYLGEETFTPSVSYIQNHKTKEVHTFVVWPQHIPIVIPKVDYIIVRKEYKKFFRKVVETGILTYGVVMSQLSEFFEPFEFEGHSGMQILSQANSDRIKKDFNALNLDVAYEEFGSMVGKDGFVNHKN